MELRNDVWQRVVHPKIGVANPGVRRQLGYPVGGARHPGARISDGVSACTWLIEDCVGLRRQAELAQIGSERNIDPIQSCYLLLIVGPAYGRLDHIEAAVSRVALVFHAAHSDETHRSEKSRREALKFGLRFRRGDTARRPPHKGWPLADFATHEGNGSL